MSTGRSYLGFDHGMKHIGVAVGQDITGSANPLTALRARDGIPDWDEIGKLIKQWSPAQCIIGLPLNMDGTEQMMTAAARKFGNRIHARFNIPVAWEDERLTTREALDQLGISGKLQAKNRADVDALSAQLILQSWLNQQ